LKPLEPEGTANDQNEPDPTQNDNSQIEPTTENLQSTPISKPTGGPLSRLKVTLGICSHCLSSGDVPEPDMTQKLKTKTTSTPKVRYNRKCDTCGKYLVACLDKRFFLVIKKLHQSSNYRNLVNVFRQK